MRAQPGQRLRRRDALECEVIEVVFEVSVEHLSSESFLDLTQQQRAFFVGDLRRAIVGVASGQIDIAESGPPRDGTSVHSPDPDNRKRRFHLRARAANNSSVRRSM